jgi:hypothetical protein
VGQPIVSAINAFSWFLRRIEVMIPVKTETAPDNG